MSQRPWYDLPREPDEELLGQLEEIQLTRAELLLRELVRRHRLLVQELEQMRAAGACLTAVRTLLQAGEPSQALELIQKRGHR